MNKNNNKNILMALLFMLIALPSAMMAQTSSERYMVITGNDGTSTVFDFDEIESVTWKVQGPQPLAGSFGTGKATIDGYKVDVPWIQLWENGPRIAKYNVGVTDGKVESLGGLYGWGKSIDKDTNHEKAGAHNLTGNEDTATNLWGSNWRMPTKEDYDAFLANCDGVWTNDYKGTKISGMIFTGKGKYSNNSVFLPAAGSWEKNDQVERQGLYGNYWSSTCSYPYIPYLSFLRSGYEMGQAYQPYTKEGFSVRAIYDPQPEPTTGTAKARINGNNVDVPWVQLWEDGPKFAEYNVGVTNGKPESAGGHYCWGSSIDNDPDRAHNKGTDALTGNDDTATNLWGSNWRMPTAQEFDALLINCDFEHTTVNGVWGTKFMGKGTYSSNSIFLRDSDGSSYWTATPFEMKEVLPFECNYAFILALDYEQVIPIECNGSYFVRAVLAE